MYINNIDISLETIQDGKLQKTFEKELEKIINSFLDKDIDKDSERKLQINLKFKLFDDREILIISDMKTTIPKKEIAATTIALTEIIPGQYDLKEIRGNRKERLAGQIDFGQLINKADRAIMYNEMEE